MRSARGQALVEFALAWPVLLLFTLAGVQLTTWGVAAHTARAAAVAGARAGSAAGAGPAVAEAVTLAALRPALAGSVAVPGCPGAAQRASGADVLVCASAPPGQVRVTVVGHLRALLPVPGGGAGLPLRVDVTLADEVFS